MMKDQLKNLFDSQVTLSGNFISLNVQSVFENQQQTNEAFSDKWTKFEAKELIQTIEQFQRDWYLKLYGFDSEAALKTFLERQPVILDAGCGLGYKAAWFAELAPETIVIGMDYSESANVAKELYAHLPNLFFVRGDIADTHLKEGVVSYVSCDQVIHHTENPEKTFRHLCERIAPGGEFACYVYAKKALPRELLDEHFRTFSKQCSKEDLWALSEQLTQLGKQLSELKIELDFPDIPLLGIKGGKQDLQRFLYWNFIKCYWNAEQGFDSSTSTNYDWYSPSNAMRYSEDEFKKWIDDNRLKTEYFHVEEACYSGRFSKPALS